MLEKLLDKLGILYLLSIALMSILLTIIEVYFNFNITDNELMGILIINMVVMTIVTLIIKNRMSKETKDVSK